MEFSDDIQELFKVIEKFTCTLYGKPKFNSVNDIDWNYSLKSTSQKRKKW